MIPNKAVEAMLREAVKVIMHEPTRAEFVLTGYPEPPMHTDVCSCDYQEVREPADKDGRVGIRFRKYVTRRDEDCAIHGGAK